LEKVDENGSGQVNIEECAKVASTIVGKLLSQQIDQDASNKIEMIRKLDEYNLVHIHD
jgi:hypothetical protein